MTLEDTPPLADRFEYHRGRLFAIAYQVLGEVGRAEDIVQEAWLRLQRLEGEPDELGPWLTTVTVRLSLDELRSARARRESYVGPWLPEPLIRASERSDPAHRVEEAEALSMAMLVILESLSPLERVVFVLREVFGYEHTELAGVLGRSDAAVRQLAHRAREHVRARRPRYRSDEDLRRRALEQFTAAALSGDTRALVDTLAEDAVILADGGGIAKAALRPIQGRERVARFILALLPQYATSEHRWEEASVNAAPGVLIWDGTDLDTVISFAVDGDRVAAIHIQRNPDKLQGSRRCR